MVARIGRKIPVIFNSARHVKHAADSMILYKRHSRILPLPEAYKKQYNIHVMFVRDNIVRFRLKFPVFKAYLSHLDVYESECTELCVLNDNLIADGFIAINVFISYQSNINNYWPSIPSPKCLRKARRFLENPPDPHPVKVL
jgi:hypothetical protein